MDSIMLSSLSSALCSAASLELRLGPELLGKVLERLDYTMKFCTAEDVGNLATALAPYNKYDDGRNGMLAVYGVRPPPPCGLFSPRAVHVCGVTRAS